MNRQRHRTRPEGTRDAPGLPPRRRCCSAWWPPVTSPDRPPPVPQIPHQYRLKTVARPRPLCAGRGVEPLEPLCPPSIHSRRLTVSIYEDFRTRLRRAAAQKGKGSTKIVRAVPLAGRSDAKSYPRDPRGQCGLPAVLATASGDVVAILLRAVISAELLSRGAAADRYATDSGTERRKHGVGTMFQLAGTRKVRRGVF